MGEGQHVKLGWLGEPPAGTVSSTWGIPWAAGTLQREEQLALLGPDGVSVPVQSWSAAYWPDGSVKWTAHAAVLPASSAGDYKITKGTPSSVDQPIFVTETENGIEVDTGVIICRLNRSGNSLIREIVRGGSRICSDGRLVAIREAASVISGQKTVREETFHSVILTAKVEQRGPLRTVIKMTGRHEIHGGGRQWLPFTLRLYFFAGQASIRVMHTFLYDGNPQQDFIKGLGISFGVPMRGPLYNRHVRLAGDTGWFSESPKGLMTMRLSDRVAEYYRRQMNGEIIEFDDQEDEAFLKLLNDSAVWNGFKQVQLSADSYTITKRTQEGCSWIRSAVGRRARGLLYAGGEGGGLAVGVRSFWQKSPTALEVDDTATDEARMTAWFWSPDAGAMDLRHYDTQTHVASAYEGADELRSTPYGVGNTSECVIWCCGSTPGASELDAMTELKESPPLLICEPEHYHASRTLGVWSLPDRSTPLKAQLEDTLGSIIAFYQEEIEQRGWYGFWDYGDVMHSYDPVRHTWRYDIGGCAWQNTELAPNIWLWYSFLRTGREDIFRLAEAMARHTSETDVYHIGEYAGLGSRHNVLHWGCGCKEARIGMAGLHKFYFYLTTDERIGDIMDEVKDSDFTTLNLDPMRAYYPKDEFPTHTRSGPDWSAFCSNWLLQWERYEDTAYRDKMLRGIECLKQMPYRLLTGPVFGYDPKTGILEHMGHENYGHHLIICMGGAQVWTEMAMLLNDPEWSGMLAEFGEFYNLSPEEKSRRTAGAINGKDWNIPMLSTAMMGYSAAHSGDVQLARQAWDILLNDRSHWHIGTALQSEPVPIAEYVRPVREIPWISTNTASQWSINLIVCLELIGRHLPAALEARNDK
ncbi:exo-rhamnogalacturonan lyase family protein [Paenibacillus abyssi]|uniref:Tat pathway signal sequence domain protein n=1 Tax=Paenibacillus abyssi TaxID=1340531 RepID=A0A917CQJ4_9BACL|nr:hypothetical protein [Paenibacillus abyssi]GGF95290.1 hypothetical protein GCM10010916_10820 [Paenibacillus abyssi]